MRKVWLCCGAACLLVVGCVNAPPPVSPTPASDRKEAEPEAEEPQTPWSKCYQFFTPSGDPMGDLGILAKQCGTANNQRPLTPVRTGKQTEHDAVDRYTFVAGGEGKCYRVFAVADSGVKDLDVQVVSPDGATVAADVSHDAAPVVPPREPLCLRDRGVYVVEVSVYKGAGSYALQVWSN